MVCSSAKWSLYRWGLSFHETLNFSSLIDQLMWSVYLSHQGLSKALAALCHSVSPPVPCLILHVGAGQAGSGCPPLVSANQPSDKQRFTKWMLQESMIEI